MTPPQERLPPSATTYAIATIILVVVGGYFVAQGLSLGLFSRSAGSSKESWPNSYDVKVHADSSDEESLSSSSSSDNNNKGEEEDEDEHGELKSFAGSGEECKLVLVVRTDLNMGKGPAPLFVFVFPFSLLPSRSLPLPSSPLHSLTPPAASLTLYPIRHTPQLTPSVPGYSTGKIAAQCSHATLACYKHFLAHAPSSPILRRWERSGQAKVALQVRSEEELETLQAQAVSLGLCAQIVRDAGRTQVASGSATVLGVGPGPKSVVDRVTGGLKLL